MAKKKAKKAMKGKKRAKKFSAKKLEGVRF